MVRYIIGAAGDKQSTEMYNTMRCHGTVQHAYNVIGSFLNNCVGDVKSRCRDIGRHPEPGEWYQVPRTVGHPNRSWPCVEERRNARKSAQLVRGKSLLFPEALNGICKSVPQTDGDVCSLVNGLVLSRDGYSCR